jgi:hypothetical protein
MSTPVPIPKGMTTPLAGIETPAMVALADQIELALGVALFCTSTSPRLAPRGVAGADVMTGEVVDTPQPEDTQVAAPGCKAPMSHAKPAAEAKRYEETTLNVPPKASETT